MRWLAGLLLACLSLALGQELELHVLDVGQGDAVLIKSPSGQAVLVDGGRGSGTALAQLRALGVTRLDLVVASHADADHIGGLAEVVQAYRPRFFMDNGLAHTTQTYRRLLEAVAGAGSQLLEPTARTLTLGEVTLRVLPPPGDPSLGQNDNSVGLLISYGAFRAALTGDAEAAEFNWWAQHHPELLVEVDVYKASHHGSENGDTPLSMSRFRPELVVISVGADNPYGHPSARALRLYAAVGARVLRTDLHGRVTVLARADGDYEAVAERDLPRVPATMPAPPLATGNGVRIACVLYNPAGRDDGNEQVTLFASGSVDVSGWLLVDAAGHRFPLPRLTLAAGERLEVGNLGGATWNNDGDTAFLYDAAGDLVDQFSYAGGGVQACR